MRGRGRGRELAWAASVAIVLADSSIVTLALPDVLTEFDASVFGVSWVLTAFNLALALAVVPATFLVRGRPGLPWVGGLIVFAGASAACALAPSLGVLVLARCVQALGGAVVIAAAIELLASSRGSHVAGAPIWGGAALAGLAIGPAAGGALTELLSWESIFFVQVPFLLLAPAGLGPARAALERGPAGRLETGPEIALGLLSAGMTGALFLLVVMLTEGWRLSPIEAAAIVSATPIATVLARPIAAHYPDRPAKLAAGAILLGGGLLALGLLPDAGFGWTIAPQALIGFGLALALPGLTARALAGRDPHGRRAAVTIAARHFGVVAGIVALTPIFDSQLAAEYEAAELSGTALLLDAPLPPSTKFDLGDAIADEIVAADGELPSVAAAFERVEPPIGYEAEQEELLADLEGEVDRAATHAFSPSFGAAALIALLALIPIGVARRRDLENEEGQ